jgi:hypothetical protein
MPSHEQRPLIIEVRIDPQAAAGDLVSALAALCLERARRAPYDLVAVIVCRSSGPAEAVRALFPSHALPRPAGVNPSTSPWAFGDVARVEWVPADFARLVETDEVILMLDGRPAHVVVVPIG